MLLYCYWHSFAFTENKSIVGSPAPRRIRFSPPAETFTLCHYSASRLQELPIFGSFTMKVSHIDHAWCIFTFSIFLSLTWLTVQYFWSWIIFCHYLCRSVFNIVDITIFCFLKPTVMLQVFIQKYAFTSFYLTFFSFVWKNCGMFALFLST